MIGGLSAV